MRFPRLIVPRPPLGLARDNGSGTIWVLILILAFSATSALFLALATVTSARHRAATAADLAALAAAGAWQQGSTPAVACGLATTVAAASGLSIVRCQVTAAGIVEVAVRIAVTLPLTVDPVAASLALQSDGSVVAWGYNALGQTNVPGGSATTRAAP